MRALSARERRRTTAFAATEPAAAALTALATTEATAFAAAETATFAATLTTEATEPPALAASEATSTTASSVLRKAFFIYKWALAVLARSAGSFLHRWAFCFDDRWRCLCRSAIVRLKVIKWGQLAMVLVSPVELCRGHLHEPSIRLIIYRKMALTSVVVVIVTTSSTTV